jgi:hypothetical protein
MTIRYFFFVFCFILISHVFSPKGSQRKACETYHFYGVGLLWVFLTLTGLVLCTHERSDLTEKIYLHLAERLEVPDWIV